MTRTLPVLCVVLVGSVDHGKSTLLGRLLHDAGAVSPAHVARAEEASRRRGVELEWSFLLDSFQAERDQAVTIDVSEARVELCGRAFAFIDAPGHVEFLRNLVAGAARADAAVLVVDAASAPGADLACHLTLLRLIGVRDVVVAVNKIDRCPDPAQAFARARRAMQEALGHRGIEARAVVPVVARSGANVIARAPVFAGWTGPSLVDALLALSPRDGTDDRGLRLPVQDVYRRGDARFVAGRVAAGALRKGDDVVVLPSGRVTRVAEILPEGTAASGHNVAVRLADAVFAERGDLVADPQHPPKLTRVFDAEVFWLEAVPLVAGDTVRVRLATADIEMQVQAIRWRLDPATGMRHDAERLARFDTGTVTLRATQPVPVDDPARFPETTRAVLLCGAEVAGIGVVDASDYPDVRSRARAADKARGPAAIAAAPRERLFPHPGMVVWLTGLPGAGKSTLALDLERRLLRAGCAAYVLDGDILRQGLNADLGFDPDARRENVRRAGEVAALFADAGLVCIVALISPYRDDREQARRSAQGHAFCEVFVDAPLAVCEARDPKGLYRKARAAQLTGFTGIDAPYERPDQADLVLRTGERSIEACGDALFETVRRRAGIA